MEQLAAQAERASIKYKQVEFMSDKLGEEFDAHISGVSEFGIYAEVDDNKCEGLISVRNLGNEGFDYDESTYTLIGRQTHHRFTLGDPIRIKVAAANLFRKQLDYEFVRKLTQEKEDSPAPHPAHITNRPSKKPKHKPVTKKKKGNKKRK
jgi:ribonuclease R